MRRGGSGSATSPRLPARRHLRDDLGSGSVARRRGRPGGAGRGPCDLAGWSTLKPADPSRGPLRGPLFSGRAAACFKAQRVATVRVRAAGSRRLGATEPNRPGAGPRGPALRAGARRQGDVSGRCRGHPGRSVGWRGRCDGPSSPRAVPGWWRRSGRPGQGGVGRSPPPVGKVAIPAASPPRGVRRLPEVRGWRVPRPVWPPPLATARPRPADVTRSSRGRTGPAARSRPRGRQRALATRPSGAGAHFRPRASPTALPILP